MLMGRTGALLALSVFAVPALAAPPQVLVFNDEGYSASEIPGVPGGIFSSFLDGFTTSQNGKRWVMRANATGQPSDADLYFLSGAKRGISDLFRENQALPGIGLSTNGQDRPMYVNDRGDVAFSGGFSTGSFSNNEVVARYTRSTGLFNIIAQENSPIPGLNGELYGGINEAAGILNDGRVLFRDSSTSGQIPSALDEFYFAGDGTTVGVELQSGTIIPANQVGGTQSLLVDLDSHTYYRSERGDHYMLRGNLGQSVDPNVLVVDGAVALQPGMSLSGVPGVVPQGFVVSRDNIGMNRKGDWFAWSASTTGDTFLLVNSQTYLVEGQAVPGDDLGQIASLIDVGISGNGDLVYAAFTSLDQYVIVVDPAGPDPAYTPIVAGIGDLYQRLDLDGDPLTNDNAFLGTISDVSIGVDGTLYFVGRAISNNFLTIGDGLYRTQVTVPSPGAGALLSCSLLALRRRRR